jgi:hypothetical protein
MIPWTKLPVHAQKVLLALAVAAGGTSTAGCFPRVCDPLPPPLTSPLPTPTLPRVCDAPPPPPRSPTPSITSTVTPTGTITPTLTVAPRTVTPTRSPIICDPPPPPPFPTQKPGGRLAPGLTQEAALLPLAEIRTVELAWAGGLSFEARSPWPAARFRWSVSGGQLVELGGQATWQPPAEAGRYLLQVAADWGWHGLAVDALVLTVNEQGEVTFA